jgi:hypothetical protein
MARAAMASIQLTHRNATMSSLYRDDWVPAVAGMTIATRRSLHKNLASTMRSARDAFSHTDII